VKQEYDNFIGRYQTSIKEGDLTFVPRISPTWAIAAEFPSVVLESGWTESPEQLNRDATLWQQGSGGRVRVVVQVKFFQRSQNRVGARLSINLANPNGGSSVKHYVSIFLLFLIPSFLQITRGASMRTMGFEWLISTT